MTARDIADIFARIELRLIQSLKRNLSAHKRQEQTDGADWHAWQAEKLRNIQKYRRQNQFIMAKYAPDIDAAAEELLEEEYYAGRQQVEIEASAASDTLPRDAFFGINHQRVDSLLADVNGSLHEAESSALRMMDDVYRQTVYKAELFVATGAATMQQAVDLAVKDFLSAGINCIEYADGRRVNIASYAEMAIRAASLRSYLRGEADKRAELGIDTVLCSQYGACSDTCLPWQGRVYIDDIWGSFDGERAGDKGKSRNGKWYSLLSFAVAAGLFHPNCRHTLSTWIEGVSKRPKPLDADKVRENATLEKRQRKLERKVRRYKRLAEGVQDPDKALECRHKLRTAQAQLRAFVADNSDVLRRDYWREKVYAPSSNIEKPSESGMILSDKSLTLSEFKQYTRERMGIDQLDIKGLSVEGVTATMRHIEAVYDELPQLRGYVSGLGQTVPDIKRVPMSTHPADDLSSVTLNFNPEMYHDLDRLKKIYADEVASGKSVFGTTWEHIGLHEMGHAAEGYIIRHRYTALPDMERDWVECITASEIITAAGHRLYGPGSDLTVARKRLSQYALESESETLAEAFCDYYANGDRAQPFSKGIMQEVRRWFR